MKKKIKLTATYEEIIETNSDAWHTFKNNAEIALNFQEAFQEGLIDFSSVTLYIDEDIFDLEDGIELPEEEEEEEEDDE